MSAQSAKKKRRPKVITPGKKDGRPSIIDTINWTEFDKLCEMQCTEKEIAAFFNCTVETINQAVKKFKGVTFLEYFGQKRKAGLISLRRLQFQAAEGTPQYNKDGELVGHTPNNTMLIWLGKQYLDQREQLGISDPEGNSLTLSYNGIDMKGFPKPPKKDAS